MSLKSKIEAVIYASEEPVTLQQLVGLLAGEAQAELDALAADQAQLPLDGVPSRDVLEAGTHERDELDDAVAEALEQGEVVASGPAAEIEAASDQVPSEQPEAPAEDAPALDDAAASEEAEDASGDVDKKQARDRERAVRDHIRRTVDGLIREYAEGDRGIEIREVASGFRMGTKPEYHDAVRGFVKSLKPALKLTLPALETLAVVAYKQPVTAAEISEIRGVDSAGVLGGLMTRKLIATAGRKQVIGRPMLYKTTRDFLLRFGLKDVNELPSMEEFERMAGELAEQEDLPMEGTDAIIEQANARGDAEMLREEASQHENESASDQDGDPAGDAETEDEAVAEVAVDDPTAMPVMDNENEEATAESAAGGNNDDEEQEKRVGQRADGGNEAAEVEDGQTEDTTEPA